ncbi:MAG: hypothetical protein PVF83_06445 [Anaerolineales bacterium]|jgi:hypothetical protein
MTTRLENTRLFPFLFGLYPVLALLAYNVDEIELSSAIRPLLLSLLLVGLLLWLGGHLVADRIRVSMLVSAYVLLFFSYGHLYFYFQDHNSFDIDLTRIRYLVPLYILILAGLTLWVLRTKRDFQSFVLPLNLAAFAAILLPLVQIGTYVVEVNLRGMEEIGLSTEFDSIELPSDGAAPDIYYIVLDGYSRGDLLAQVFDYDNSGFLDALTQRGFYVANCSQANYSWTLPSIASTFKMDYLDAVTEQTRVAVRFNDLRKLILYGPVRQLVEGLGYTTVAFETGYKWQHWVDADVYIVPQGVGPSLNEFEWMLFDTSALRILSDAHIVKDTYADHRQHVLNAFASLEALPIDIPGPKFVYAHIIAPHEPFVFGPEGEWLQNLPENQLVGYRDQVNYVNIRMIEIVDILIEQSPTPPIIIIQGDHGAPINWEAYGYPNENKLAILSAYYLPGVEASDVLYDSITPVNSFRLIFDKYFNGDLDLLEDLSYFGRQSPPILLPCE